MYMLYQLAVKAVGVVVIISLLHTAGVKLPRIELVEGAKAATANVAVAGYKVAGIDRVARRNGPGTNYRRLGWIKGGSPIEIACQQRGMKIRGTSIWNRLTDGGWITDYYVSTPVFNDFSPGIPRCDQGSAGTKEQRAIDWDWQQVGKTHQADGKKWNNWCDRFVANAYGMTNSGYATAYIHWQDLLARGLARVGDRNVPAGGLAFFLSNWAGHVMLSLGDGRFISTGPKVFVTDANRSFGQYLGWAPANPEWLGRK